MALWSASQDEESIPWQSTAEAGRNVVNHKTKGNGMRLRLLGCLLPAGILAGAAFGQSPTFVNNPSNGEENLAQILGFDSSSPVSTTANQNLNNAIYNQTAPGSSASVLTDFQVPFSSLSSTLVAQYAGNAGNNSFGIYGVTSSGGVDSGGGLVQVFPGTPENSGQQYGSVTITYNQSLHTLTVGSTTVTLSSADTGIGFYMSQAPGLGNLTFTSTLNGSAANDFQHFVAVQASSLPAGNNFASLGAGSILMGIEDETIAEGTDKDYNDMVVSITPVPEPTTLVAGMLLLLPFGASTLRVFRKTHTA